MGIKPLGDRVLVKIEEAKDKTESGLFIPVSAQERPYQGKIVSAGPGKRNEAGVFIEVQVKKNDVVLLPKFSGTEITISGKPHVILHEEEIIGVVVDDE